MAGLQVCRVWVEFQVGQHQVLGSPEAGQPVSEHWHTGTREQTRMRVGLSGPPLSKYRLGLIDSVPSP